MFFCSVFDLLPNFSDFSYYSTKDLKLIENRFFSSEKIINSGNCIYDYAQLFFVKDL